MSEHRMVAVRDLQHIIDGLQQIMTDIGLASLRAQRLRDIITQTLQGLDPDTPRKDVRQQMLAVIERERNVYEELWHLAAGQLSFTQGRILMLERELRALAQGCSLYESTSPTSPKEFDVDAAVVAYLQTRALDDLEPGPPGAL